MAFYKDPRVLKKEHTHFPFSSHYEEKLNVWPHYHEMIELQFFVEGECDVFLGNNSYKMNPGDLLIINSEEIHSLYSKKGTSFIVVQIDPEFLYTSDKTSSRIRYVYPFLHSNSYNPRLFKKGDLADFPVGEIMYNILNECKSMEFGFELSVKGDIFKLFFRILRHLKETGRISDINFELDRGTISAFDKVFEFVKNNYSSNITAKDAAKVANLSYSYFSRLFNSVMDTSFTEYLNSVRLGKSEQLLINTDKPITEIAIECGFCTSSYFIHKFKQKNNISPLGFRKKFKSN